MNLNFLKELAFRGFNSVGLRWCLSFPGDAEVTGSVHLGVASMGPSLFYFFHPIQLVLEYFE